MTAVVAALPEELRALRRRLRMQERRRIGSRPCEIGELLGATVALLATGDGAARARAGLEALLDAVSPRRLLLIGVAGAASPGLSIGSIVAPRRIFDGVRPAPAPDRAWLGRALEGPGVQPGVLVSVNRIVTSVEERAEIARRFEGEPVILDLETAAWAVLAAARGLPYLALRAVSDAGPADLPRWLVERLTRDGTPDRWRIAVGAIASPTRLAALARLSRTMRVCSRRLAEAAVAVI